MVPIPNELIFIASCIGIVILFLIFSKRKNADQNIVRDELRLGRNENSDSARKLREEVVKTIGNPSSKSDNFIIWESQNEQFSIEFPKRMHGYIHLMKSNVKL